MANCVHIRPPAAATTGEAESVDMLTISNCQNTVRHQDGKGQICKVTPNGTTVGYRTRGVWEFILPEVVIQTRV
jgi:hypothetical protein